MEEAPDNGKESSNSAHANGMNEWNFSPKNYLTPLWNYLLMFNYLDSILPYYCLWLQREFQTGR